MPDISARGRRIPNPSPYQGRERTERIAHPSSRLAQDDTHGVEQVDRYADPAGGGDARADEPEHSPQLKGDERSWNDLPGMVEMLQRKPERGGQAAHARPREEPQMLRRRHQPPSRAGEPRR